VGHLWAVEQRRKSSTPPAADGGGRLLLTEEEWAARMKAREKGGSGGSGNFSGNGSSDGNRGRGRGRGRNRGGGRNGGGNEGAGRGACHSCGKMGHWARECRSKAKKSEAHMAHDDEPSLLLMEAVEIQSTEIAPPPPPAISPAIPPGGAPIVPVVGGELVSGHHAQAPHHVEEVLHLVEERVFAQFSDAEEKECHRWVLDTGATNHMTGSRSAFSDLNRSIQGTVRFGDGSVVQIEGVGTILFRCKNGEHWEFTGVYYIPKLNTNIVSVGQLNENGFQTIIDGGVMKIRDAKRRLLVKVIRSPNRLYVLNVEIARLVCLLARGSEEAWLWHTRYNHLNFPALRKLARDDMVRGLPKLEQVDQVCGGCLAGKHRRASFP
jgi:hypothetical protein